MKCRLISACLALILAMGLCVPAMAAENSTDNFTRTKIYAGEFSDMISGSTFYDNAVAMYEYGLSVGKTDGTFGGRDNLTVGQIVIFAGRIHSLYSTGNGEAGADGFRTEGQAAYAPYLAYLQKTGVLGAELDGLYETNATRAQVARVLAATLPETALPRINEDLITQCYASRQYLPDVTEYTPYYQEILTLYKAGVSVGSDARGSFQPDAAITRGAAAAMLTRMVDATLRLTPEWTLKPNQPTTVSAVGTTWGSLIAGDSPYIAAPRTEAEMAQAVAYMLTQESNQLDLNYNGRITKEFVRQLMETSLDAAKSYCEQMYNSVDCSYDTRGGAVTMLFSAVEASLDLPKYRKYTLEAAITVHDRLWSEGTITSNMTEAEKARVYYDWICKNCVYDETAGEISLSHIAYALFKNGRAVCDGYTGAYNLLLKLEGIDCYAQTNPDHVWTVATLDGTAYHIDSTWGDNNSGITDYSYFAMSAEQSWKYHTW